MFKNLKQKTLSLLGALGATFVLGGCEGEIEGRVVFRGDLQGADQLYKNVECITDIDIDSNDCYVNYIDSYGKKINIYDSDDSGALNDSIYDYVKVDNGKNGIIKFTKNTFYRQDGKKFFSKVLDSELEKQIFTKSIEELNKYNKSYQEIKNLISGKIEKEGLDYFKVEMGEK